MNIFAIWPFRTESSNIVPTQNFFHADHNLKELNTVHSNKSALRPFVAESTIEILTRFGLLLWVNVIRGLSFNNVSKLATILFLTVSRFFKIFANGLRLLNIGMQEITFFIWKSTVAVHPKSTHFLFSIMVWALLLNDLVESYEGICT